jgi:hypothetical protein
MAIVSKSVQQIIEEGMDRAFKEMWQKEMLRQVGWIGLRIEMPKRGRYQVWDGMNLVADRIKHRKEALALMKLLTSVNK